MDESEVFNLLDKQTVDATPSSTSYQLTTKKGYHQLQMHRNVTSYSLLLKLHECPRKLQLNRYTAMAGGDRFSQENYHFAFGHSVGAGVQSLFLSGDIDTALFNSFLAWEMAFDARLQKKKKSIWEAGIAVEKFHQIIVENLYEWDLVSINGKPGIELAFSIDCGNGYKHYGHIDVILRNKMSGVIAVIELKTTGLTSAEEALYANSSQALGYSIVLDTLFPELSSYEVFHFVYSSSDRSWEALPFTKTISHKAEWIKDLLLDQAMLEKYEELKFYPKRGESCYNYFSRCEYFGSCNLIPDEPLPVLDMNNTAEEVDIELHLADIVRAQQQRKV